MTARKLYGTNKLVDDFIVTLVKTEILDGGWTVKYSDSMTGQEWLKYCVGSDKV
jgi:hypothetical protein